MNTWYVNIAVSDKKAIDGYFNKSLVPEIIMGYERGRAKMKIEPKKGDKIIVLSRKHIVYYGSIISDLYTTIKGKFYQWRIMKQNPPIFIGKCFRRNYTLCKDTYDF